uniref:centrosome-associated protein 350 n=1 Tax=Panthera onca TaxID=9690 RepID=UPI002954D6AC|nr:centrosome-associated protein 350 [Panthera onca]
MKSSKSKEVPLPNPRNSQSKDTVQADITTSWNALSQTKAALRHIENKLEVVPTSTAVFDSVMDTKKSSASATRKISRKDGRFLDDSWVNAPTSKSSKSRKEKSRSPLRVTTLESNIRKNNRVEFREPLVSYREIHGTPSNISPSHLESKHVYCVDVNEEKPESGNRMICNREERNIHCCDFESSPSSVINDTVVRFLNDRPAIDALQNSECLIKMAGPVRTEEEKPSRAKGNEKASVSNMGHDVDPKVLRITDSSPSSTSTCNSQRLDILKQRQHDVKLEKLKERIRKQWEHSEETNGRGQNLGHIDHPVMVVNVDNSVTAKVRKVATAPPAPTYKGFNPSETKIRTPDGKVWQEAEFQNMSRELYRDLALHFADDISMKEKPAEKSKEKKVVKPVRKVQKVTQLSSPEGKTGSSRLISTSSWRDGQKLVKKILGPAPRLEQKERRTASSDRSGRERTTKSGGHIGRAESDPRLDVSHRHLPRNSERSRSRARSETNTKKLAPSLPDNKQEDSTALNKDFLPLEIRGILDDLQLDSTVQAARQEIGELQNPKSSTPVQAPRSHSPVKRKPDKITANEDPPVISKKRHYDTDEVRQYIVRQQEERKRKQNEEKKAQKEATEQKNKRLQELYRKQKEAFTKVKNVPPSEPSVTRRLQETYSKLLLEKTLLEEPPHQHVTQETQTRPGYQPSGESDKENKVQERPLSASSSSDMSLSEPPQPLARKDLMEPTWMQPDRLSPRVHNSQPQPLAGTAGNLLSHLLSLEHVGILNKDFESILPPRKNHNMASGPLTFTPQPYLTSPAAHPDALLKPSASQYKSKLDRIEALKATAASLSSRIESEAKKLAGANINYGSVWSTEYDVQRTPQEDGSWTKAPSPPMKEDTEDIFSARIQKMMGTCVSHATFDDDLPGVGNLSEFKKLPEMIRPHSAISRFRMRSPGPKPEGLLTQLCKRQTDSSSSDMQACSQDKAKLSLGSSTDSVSEGPLLSEGSLSEEEGGHDGQPPLKVAEILKEKEFCAGERNGYEPIKEFQKEAEKFLPLFGHIGGTQSKGPWEELAKGSPHSVINIFTKSYQLYGKGFEDRLERGTSASRPLNAVTTPVSSVSYEDDFVSSPGSGTLTERKSALEPNIAAGSVGLQEDHCSRKSAYDLSSVDITSQRSSGAQSAASSRSSASSKGKKGKKEWLDSLTGNVQNSLLDEEKVHSGSERGSHQGKKSGTSSKVSVKDFEQTLDTDSVLEDLSGHSVSVSSDKGRSQKTPTSPLSPSSQKLLQFDLPGTSLERSKSSVIMPPSVTGFKPNAPFTDMNPPASRTPSEMASAPGSKRFSPAGLQHRMAAELSYLSAIEESVRQLSDVERVRGISLAQQESVSLAQIIKVFVEFSSLAFWVFSFAEIKRLQEANKAARKERQLILKQQEEIERIRQTTMKLQEKLKSAGENKLDSHSDDDTKNNKATSPGPTDLETRSPSPISISSSETSSIMQKLKKMRSRMDEKHCSPVHYFFSVFTSHHWASLSVCFPNLHPKFQLYIYNQLVRFLTKREQKLMQRRQHAEELLEWKRRLDAEEAEIRQMEKQALAAWDKELIKPKTPKKEIEDQRTEQKEIASEAESPVPSYSHLHSESSIPEELGSPAVGYIPSESIVQEQSGSPDHSVLTEEMVFSQELESSTSPSKHSPPKSCTSVSKQESSKGSHRTGGQYRLPIKSHQHCSSWSDESLSMTQSETTSDQSDIEGRIRALKDELRKRKSVVDQLKKEQRKRQKERLKAQEASLIKQLESYDEFIKKTEAELSRDLETSPTAKPQIKTLSSASEKPKIKPLPLHRSETAKNWKSLTESERARGSLESIAEHVDAALAGSERSVSERSLSAYVKRVIELDRQTEEHFQTSSPILRSSRKARTESGDSLENVPSLSLLKELNAPNRILDVLDAKVEEASQKSEIQEVDYAKLEESVIEEAYSKQCRKSDVLLKLDLEQGDSSEILSRKDLPLDSVNVQKDLVRLASENLHKKQSKERESDQGTDHSTSTQSEKEVHEQRNIKERDSSLSEHLFAPKETSYSEDFEVSSLKKDISAELYKDDFEVSSLLSLRKDSQSCRDESRPTKNSTSRATSLGSDDEISECLSEKSLSVHSSVHSERLLELKSPTELMKSKERSDVEHEQGVTEPPSLVSVSVADELHDFHIGDRVLIGNVQPGTLRFKGVTSFAKGFWAGVELDKAEGNNNGTYDGIVYFVCREKHGIFAPPQKISHIPENFDDYVDINEDEESYSDGRYQYYNQEQKDTADSKFDREKDAVEYFYENSLPSMHDIEASLDRSLKIETDKVQDVSGVLEAHVHQQSSVDSLISSKENKDVPGAIEKVSIAVEGDTLDNAFSEELKQQQQLTEKEEDLCPEVSEKLSTPLLDLLAREKNQLEAQLRSSLNEEQSKQQLEKVSLLTDSLLTVFVKDTVNQLQEIKKARNEKIQLSNQGLLDDDRQSMPPQGLSQNLEEQSSSVPDCFLRPDLEDEKEEISSPDICPRPESPVFGASGQEELAKRLAELEISREFLSVLGDDQDWFDEDFGLSSSHKIPKNKAEETIVPLMAEPKRAPQKPCETLLAVPHTTEEVETLVHNAVEELWKWKELGHDLHSISVPTKLLGCASKGLDIESTSKRVYKQAVFDLTKEIFEEIFAEDPNLNQPVWMKPCRINSSYFRRVKNPNNLDEIKNFIATEVLKLFSLKKEPNHKTDWQKMMKFGRKKRDRVDHILVQELHEEEAQWVNYDEDELCVKMQLAEGIFETLIRDTIDVLNQISEKQGRMLLV